MTKPLIILGAGGHASVLADIALSQKKIVLGICNPVEATIRGFEAINYLGDDTTITKFDPLKVRLINGMGATSVQKNLERRKLFYHFKQLGFVFETLIHPFSIIASCATLHEGAQVMAGAIIQPNVIISENVIVNTGVSIDHDCKIGHSVHLAPRSVLSGGVTVGENSMLGVGSVIIQGIHIEDNTMIRAGSIMTHSMVQQIENAKEP